MLLKLFHIIQRESAAPNSFCDASITPPKVKDLHAHKHRETETETKADTDTERL